MPYITQERKDQLDLNPTHYQPIAPGDLTYMLFVSVRDYDADQGIASDRCQEVVEQFVRAQGKFRYKVAAEVLGCLLSTKLEFERREAQAHLGTWMEGFGGSRRASIVIDPVIDWFYQDIVAPYEDTKIEENGDVL